MAWGIEDEMNDQKNLAADDLWDADHPEARWAEPWTTERRLGHVLSLLNAGKVQIAVDCLRYIPSDDLPGEVREALAAYDRRVMSKTKGGKPEGATNG